MPDTLDDHAFAAACEAAPDVDPEAIRCAEDAYVWTLHLHVVRITEGRPLSAEEAEAAFAPRVVEG